MLGLKLNESAEKMAQVLGLDSETIEQSRYCPPLEASSSSYLRVILGVGAVAALGYFAYSQIPSLPAE